MCFFWWYKTVHGRHIAMIKFPGNPNEPHQKDSLGCRFWAMYANYADLEAAHCKFLINSKNSVGF